VPLPAAGCLLGDGVQGGAAPGRCEREAGPFDGDQTTGMWAAPGDPDL